MDVFEEIKDAVLTECATVLLPDGQTAALEDADAQPGDAAEDKNKKFREIGLGRVQRAARAIDLIGNLSNKSSYSYTDEEVEQVFAYLQQVVDDTHDKFADKALKEFAW